MTTPRILVVGSSNTDLMVRAERLPRPGETVLGGGLTSAAGGKGANQAVAAARLGAHVTLVACIGDDAYGHEALAAFAREGLDTTFVTCDPAASSGVALIIVGPGGENLIAVAPGANNRLRPPEVEMAGPAFENADILLLQLESPLKTVLAAAQRGKTTGMQVILNPAPARSLPNEVLELVDVLTPNQHEAAELSGEAEPSRAAAALMARGPRAVIVTLGSKGAWLATADENRLISGFQIEAVDATAAGDAFNGALAVAIGRGESWLDAIRFAHAAAALSVTRAGAQPSLPTAAEVQQFLAAQS